MLSLTFSARPQTYESVKYFLVFFVIFDVGIWLCPFIVFSLLMADAFFPSIILSFLFRKGFIISLRIDFYSTFLTEIIRYSTAEKLWPIYSDPWEMAARKYL